MIMTTLGGAAAAAGSGAARELPTARKRENSRRFMRSGGEESNAGAFERRPKGAVSDDVPAGWLHFAHKPEPRRKVAFGR
jgi:hypothetical protein